MDSLFTLHGHDAAVHVLESALRDGRLHHAHLITGPGRVGKRTLALQLAQAATCAESDEGCRDRVASGRHPDVRMLSVDSEAAEGPRTLIGIEAIRDVISSAHLQPYEGRMRVFIIDGADRMSTDAANALLKVLEEPPAGVLLLLLSDNPEGVLPTVRSRCQSMELRPLPVEQVAALLRDEYQVSGEQAQVLARLSRGCIGWAIEAARDPSPMAAVHQQVERIVDTISGGLEERFAYAEGLARRFQRDRAAGREELFLWMRWLRDVLLVQQGCSDGIVNISWRETIGNHAQAMTPAQTVRWIHQTTETVEALDRNANARLALEALMLNAPEIRVSTEGIPASAGRTDTPPG
ncbi:MAG: DNA polymerase III subunit [Dehalococcoidia bacterium]